MASYRRYNCDNPFSRKRKYVYYKDRGKSDKNCSMTEDNNKCPNKCNKQCCNNTDNFPQNFFTNNDATVTQDGGQYSFMDQESAELIWVKESCNITVNSRDTQAGLSLQAALQLAIALVLNIAIGDDNQGKSVTQELLQQFNGEQTNKQKIFIYNSKDATVTTTDIDLAVNIQLLLQVLVVLVVMIDVL